MIQYNIMIQCVYVPSFNGYNTETIPKHNLIKFKSI